MRRFFNDFSDLRSDGAQKRTRTSTPLRAPAPEAGASTNSAIWARSRCAALAVIAAMSTAVCHFWRCLEFHAIEPVRRYLPACVHGRFRARAGREKGIIISRNIKGAGMSKLVTVFGCGGFVGRFVAQELLAAGWRVRAAERNPQSALAIKPMGNLGQTQFISANVTQIDSVRRAVAGADAVVNLVGVFGKAMQAVHVDGARNVAVAAAEAGVGAMVHISAIGADAKSPARYGQTKAEGEAAVLAAFPTATILRPSVVFGQDDAFLNRFADLIRMFPVVPVIGAATRLQPVFGGDVGKAVLTALSDPAQFGGRVFELGGPEAVTMRALNERIAEMIGRKRPFLNVPGPFAKLLAVSTGWAPGAPISNDQLKMLGSDNVVAEGAAGLAELGITPTSMAAVAPRYLSAFRKHGRFGTRIEG